MSHLPLDARAILEYLNELGFRNISAEQLKEFMKDLRKLIKYEERLNLNAHQDDYFDRLFKRSTVTFRAKLDKDNGTRKLKEASTHASRPVEASKSPKKKKNTKQQRLQGGASTENAENVNPNARGAIPKNSKTTAQKKSDSTKLEHANNKHLQSNTKVSTMDAPVSKLIHYEARINRHHIPNWKPQHLPRTREPVRLSVDGYLSPPSPSPRKSRSKKRAQSPPPGHKNDGQCNLYAEKRQQERTKSLSEQKKRSPIVPRTSSMARSTNAVSPHRGFVPPPPENCRSGKPINDPVALYQYYKREWKHFRRYIPGENSRTELRWQIRHRMSNSSKK